jgi:putative oxidoreductase
MDVIELLGRLLLAAVFFISPSGVLKTAPRIAGTPMMKAFPVGLGTFLVRVTCLEAMVGAVLIALGLWPDLGALLVLGFIVPVTLTMHRFWDMEPGLPRKQKRDVFLSNTGLAGGALILLAAVNQAQDVGIGVLTHPLIGHL